MTQKEKNRHLAELLETVSEFLDSVDWETSERLVKKAHDLKPIVDGFFSLLVSEGECLKRP